MATQRRARSAPPAPPADDPIDPTGDELPNEGALSLLLADLQGAEQAKVTVYRVRRDAPPGYLFATIPEQFSLDELRDVHGGGDFRVYVTGGPRNKMIRNTLIRVEPRATTAAAAPATPADESAALRELAALRRELAERAPAPPPQPAQEGPTFASIATNLPQIITALSGALVALRPPAPPAPPAAAPNEGKLFDVLLRGIELGRELSSGGGDGDGGGILGLVREAFRSPILAQAVAASTQQRRAAPARPPAPPQQPAAPAALPPAAAPAQPPTPEGGDDVMQAILRSELHKLVRKAAAGGDPGLYAELIVDNVPIETLHELLQAPPDPVTALAQVVPEVEQHREWFGQLVDGVRAILAQVAAAEAAGGGGDTPGGEG